MSLLFQALALQTTNLNLMSSLCNHNMQLVQLILKSPSLVSLKYMLSCGNEVNKLKEYISNMYNEKTTLSVLNLLQMSKILYYST